MTETLTRFFGRHRELAEVTGLLRNRRLVTLTGLGGTGKTRLARKVCELVRSSFPDGTWFADLGPIVDGTGVGQRLAGTLGLVTGPSADPVVAVVARLAARQVLLVLDTCEHLVDPVSEVATQLLNRCPGVVVLATSREPLHVAGEAVYEVPPLDEMAAAELFVDRAALALPRFDPEAAREDVASICAKVDRLPLALELAAAWIATLGPSEILLSLDDALGLLTGGPRAGGARHRALRASLAWSYDLLNEEERAFFRRLGVFPAAFGPDAARSVAGWDHGSPTETMLLLRRLRAVSLLTIHDTRTDTPASTRYRLLDTVRRFALDRLDAAGETERTRERHLDHHLHLGERAEQGLDEQQDTWRETLQDHYEDIVAAVRWGLTPDNSASDRGYRARRLAAAMAKYWMLTGNTVDGMDLLARAEAASSAGRGAFGSRDGTSGEMPTQGRAEAHLVSRLASGTAMVAMVSGRRALVTEAAERGLTAAEYIGDARMQAQCRMMLAYPLFFTDFAHCQALAVACGEEGASPGKTSSGTGRRFSRATPSRPAATTPKRSPRPGPRSQVPGPAGTGSPQRSRSGSSSLSPWSAAASTTRSRSAGNRSGWRHRCRTTSPWVPTP